MRQENREIKEFNEIIEVMKNCDVCRLAHESVIGRGRIRILDEEEKMDALKKLMDHYHMGKDAYFNPAAISRTLVYVLEVEKMTGKRKKPK